VNVEVFGLQNLEIEALVLNLVAAEILRRRLAGGSRYHGNEDNGKNRYAGSIAREHSDSYGVDSRWDLTSGPSAREGSGESNRSASAFDQHVP
jgi:hypothetical protein